MGSTFLIIYCGLVLSLSAFSIDITLPALFPMAKAFSASIDQVQMTIPVYVLTFGGGQILFGAASDRFGRKPLIILGLGIFLAGALFSFLAPSLDALLAGRFLQGLGAGCNQVTVRAVLRDRHSGAALGQAMAIAMGIFAFGPVAAPLLGYGLIELGGWRFVFVGIFIFSALLMAVTLWRMPETLVARDPLALKPAHLKSALLAVLTNGQSRFFIGYSALIFFVILSFVANAPRFYAQDFGVTGLGFAVSFAIVGFGIIPGQILNKSLIRRRGILYAIRVASVGTSVFFGLMFVLTFYGLLGAAGFTALLAGFGACSIITMTNGAALCIDPHFKIAGFTSSLFGFVTQLSAAVLVGLTVPLFAGSVVFWSGSQALLALGMALCMLFWRQPDAG